MSADTDGIRAYLQYLSDPASLDDHATVADAHKRLDAANDPYERVMARGALNRATNHLRDAARADFVEHAKAWAHDHGITADDLLAEGVPEQDLRDAGLLPHRQPATRKRTRTSIDSIKATASAMRGEFTIAELEAASGASPMSVRKAMRAMLDAGTLKALGPDRTRTGRGRLPILYTTT